MSEIYIYIGNVVQSNMEQKDRGRSLMNHCYWKRQALLLWLNNGRRNRGFVELNLPRLTFDELQPLLFDHNAR